MSKLAVANIIFETTEANRIEYTGNNVVRVRANGGLQIPFGTTAQRVSPEYGIIRFNTDLQTVEMYDAGGWYNMPTGGYVNVIYSAANATYASGNANWIATNAAYASVNSNWNVTNTVYGVANAAFAAANNVAPQVTPAFLTGNLAYALANTVYAASNSNWTVTNALYSVANSAFAAANNVGPQIAPTYNTANAAFAAANTKFSSSGGTISGAVEITADLTVHGNTRFIDQQTLQVGDPLIYLAANNYTSDVVDIGFVANYVNSTSSNVHTGLFRSSGTKEYYLFQGYDREPAGNYIDPTGNNITMAVLNSTVRTSNLILGGANAINWITSAYASINSNWSVTNTVYGVANAAFGKANTALQNTSGVTFGGNLSVSGNLDLSLSTGAVILPVGTTAQRPASPSPGMIRFNSTVGAMEQYISSGDGWQSISPSPVITSVTPTTFNGEQGSSFGINGTAFDTAATVKFITSSGSEYSAATVSRSNSSFLTATTPQDFTVANEPLKVKVINGTGLSSVLENAIDCGGSPTWNTASGSLASVYDAMRDVFSTSVSASDPDAGATISYSLVSGSLPTNMSISSSGSITGTAAAVVSDTTYNFTIRATDNAGNSTDRAFSITIRAPIVETFAYTGSTQTWTKPSGLTKAVFKVWGAAGGAGTSYFSTYGGPGGYGYATVDVSGVSSLNVVVGQGGGIAATGERSTYGHLLNSTDGRAGGFGASCGCGGGLSGIFNGSVTTQSNAILIAGGGGGAGQINNQRIHGAGGAGGGPNQSGDDGYDNPATGGAHGRGGTTTGGGRSGLSYYVSPNGSASSSVATSGSALCGGHAHTASNWTEGGGGGSGYYGGGSGAHETDGGYWSAAGGGSGYASGLCSNVVAYKGTYESQSSQATSDVNFSSGIGIPVAGAAGGNGLVVVRY